MALLTPAIAMAQVGVGPGTPVTPAAAPEPTLPSNATSPTDYQAPVPAPEPSGEPGGAAPAAPPSGYSGGDYMIVDANPALWGGVRGARKKIPPFHVVRQGDTLWEICDHYYSDAWAWPQLWAYNRSITNPHWIYPGDRVRLLGAAAPGKGSEAVRRTRDILDHSGPITLQQNAFADPKDIEDAGVIVGSKEERLLLSYRDELYIEGKGNFQPKVGQSYSIYRVRKKLKSGDGKYVGNQVEILGTARIKRTPKDKAATAVVTESIAPIERNDRIGPLRRRFQRLPIRPADRNVTGRVIGAADEKIYHGIDELVYVDRGVDHGVQKGNRFLVLQRGDGYHRLLQDEDTDDPNLPREAVAEISIIDARKQASVGVITRAVKEIREGDYLKMRRGY